jgi:hypothetical protein
MSWLLEIVTCDWSSTASETSSGSSYSSLSCTITSWHVILWCLIILHGIVLGFFLGCTAVVCCLLRSIILLLHSVLWGWGLVKLGSYLPSHHFCTLYASDVLSRINSMVLQYLSSCLTDLKKLQYELFGTVWNFCIIGMWYGLWSYFLQISHNSPLIGNGFGIPASIYYANVAHSFLWCPSISHVVPQMTSRLYLIFFRFS